MVLASAISDSGVLLCQVRVPRSSSWERILCGNIKLITWSQQCEFVLEIVGRTKDSFTSVDSINSRCSGIGARATRGGTIKTGLERAAKIEPSISAA